MQTFIFNKFRNLTLKKFLSILFVLSLVIGGVAYAGGKCTPCYINNYCQKGIMQSCPADRPVTMTTRTNSPDGCITCNERNGNETNPIFDPLVGDCVSCLEYDSSTPVWNGTSCVACASGTAYNAETGLCESTCPANTVANEAGVCILSKAINECEAGYIGISTAEQLAKIGVDANYPLSGNYCLLNDISLSAYKSGEGWTPIGPSNKFTGIFDGNGHEISDLYINRPSTNYQGLFGQVYKSSAQIRNLGLVDVNVTGASYVGGLVGNNNTGTISNSYVTGSVVGASTVGGLIGSNSGDITNSYATGSVTGTGIGDYVGGLVGHNYSGTISNSYATGSVTGTGTDVGGLVGQNWEGTISNSYATGSVTGTSSFVGGLVGQNWEGTISNSYATGSVEGASVVGGLVGRNYYNGATITNSYFDTATTGMTVACGVNDEDATCSATGKTTAEMQTPSTFSSWDTTIWELVQGQYPKLKDVGGQ